MVVRSFLIHSATIAAMPPFRPPFHAARALELPHSYAPRRILRPNTLSSRQIRPPRRCMSDFPPSKRPDPMEEWRNPKPSKWPNRIRLLMLPFIGALIYSMVGLSSSYHAIPYAKFSSGRTIRSKPKHRPSPKKTNCSNVRMACPSNRPCACGWNSS